MKNLTEKLTPKNISFYFIGVFVLGLGAVSGIASNFGAGPWDTTSYNLSLLLHIKLGYASFIIIGTLILLTVYLTKKIELLIMGLTAVFVSTVINFWFYTIFNEYIANSFMSGLPYYITSLFVIPLGLALIVASTLPALVFDELTFAVMAIFKLKNVAVVRSGMEVFGVTLAIIFSLLAGEGLGAVGLGSAVIALTLGPIMSIYFKLLRFTR